MEEPTAVNTPDAAGAAPPNIEEGEGTTSLGNSPSTLPELKAAVNNWTLAADDGVSWRSLLAPRSFHI